MKLDANQLARFIATYEINARSVILVDKGDIVTIIINSVIIFNVSKELVSEFFWFVIKVKSLENKIDKRKNKIDELKEDNSALKRTINYFENLFDKLVKFIKNRIFGKEKNQEDYMHFSKELYEHGIFSDKTIENTRSDYN